MTTLRSKLLTLPQLLLKGVTSSFLIGVFVIPSSFALAEESKNQQRLITGNNTCQQEFAKVRSSGAEGAADILISLADTVLGEVFSLVDKWLEKRKKDLSATYGTSEMLTTGLESTTRCFLFVNGSFSESVSTAPITKIDNLNDSFYKQHGVDNIDSFFAIEVESEVLSGGERQGVGLLKITPYHAVLFKSSAKRQKKDHKNVVLTFALETAHKDPKKGFQKEEIKNAFDIGEMENGDQKSFGEFGAKVFEEYVDAKLLQRPSKINVTVVESEEQAIYEKIAVSFYESEKENIKKTIQKIWGTSEED